jgi:hypothetical protein
LLRTWGRQQPLPRHYETGLADPLGIAVRGVDCWTLGVTGSGRDHFGAAGCAPRHRRQHRGSAHGSIQASQSREAARQLLIYPNPWPISLVAIGLATGASAGLYASSHDWFLRDLKATADRLVEAGVDQRTAAQALLAHYDAAPQPASAGNEKAAPQAASGTGFGLYAEKTEFCEDVRGNQLAPIKDMRKILNRSDSAAVKEVSQKASDGEVAILMRIICPR